MARPGQVSPDPVFHVQRRRMQKHSPEPWSVRVLDDGTVELLDANHKTILELWSPEGCEHTLIHAARIMACVNVWEGTSTEELDYVLRGRQLVKNRDKQLKKA